MCSDSISFSNLVKPCQPGCASSLTIWDELYWSDTPLLLHRKIYWYEYCNNIYFKSVFFFFFCNYRQSDGKGILVLKAFCLNNPKHDNWWFFFFCLLAKQTSFLSLFMEWGVIFQMFLISGFRYYSIIWNRYYLHPSLCHSLED